MKWIKKLLGRGSTGERSEDGPLSADEVFNEVGFLVNLYEDGEISRSAMAFGACRLIARSMENEAAWQHITNALYLTGPAQFGPIYHLVSENPDEHIGFVRYLMGQHTHQRGLRFWITDSQDPPIDGYKALHTCLGDDRPVVQEAVQALLAHLEYVFPDPPEDINDRVGWQQWFLDRIEANEEVER